MPEATATATAQNVLDNLNKDNAAMADYIDYSLGLQASIGRTVYLEGPPSCGKTKRLYAWAESHGYHVLVIVASQIDPVDLRGAPIPVQIKTTDMNEPESWDMIWARPDCLPRDGKWLIVLDDLPGAAPSVMVSLHQLIDEKRVGKHGLPPETFICGTGNRSKDKAGANKLPTGVSSRFGLIIGIEPDAEDWLGWAGENDIHPLVMAYIRNNPEHIHQLDTKVTGPWPNYRSWHAASDMMKQDPPTQFVSRLMENCLGLEVGRNFATYCKLAASLPDIDALLADPDNGAIPQELGTLTALVSMLTQRGRKDPSAYGSLVKYACRLADNRRGDFGRNLIHGLEQLESFKQSQAYIDLCTTRSDLA